ncbi:helix-turn-helix transcriptional regulator [Saccharopolyspora sp. ASAGF58]|nr:helix-turn-helix transcriptional regulator [Saccharopolyspora sp. ASAGF58]
MSPRKFLVWVGWVTDRGSPGRARRLGAHRLGGRRRAFHQFAAEQLIHLHGVLPTWWVLSVLGKAHTVSTRERSRTFTKATHVAALGSDQAASGIRNRKRPMHEIEHVGAAIKLRRKAYGMTQVRLAEMADVSLSLLGKIECGGHAATHAVLANVARALRVPVEMLTCQPALPREPPRRRTAPGSGGAAVGLRRSDLPPDVTSPKHP